MNRVRPVVTILAALAVCNVMFILVPAEGSPSHWFVSIVAGLDSAFLSRFSLGLAASVVGVTLVGRAVVAWMDAQERVDLQGYEQIEVQSSRDMSAQRLRREKAGLLPVAVEVWHDPRSGAIKKVNRFW